MKSKTMSIFLIVTLMLAFTISSASAACSKAGTCSSASSCTGSSCSTCKTCSKTVCVSYMHCTDKEYLRITNGLSTPVNLKGWKVGLKCGGCTKEVRYNLPAVTVKPCKSIWIYTGKAPGALCFGTNGNILSCKGEVARIYNSSGKLVSTRTN